MAYKIQYSPEDAHRYPQRRPGKPAPWRRILIAAAILLGALWVRQRGIPDFLIPGDREITVAAAENMVEGLRQGIGVRDAVTVFCKEILHGAGV